MMSFDFSNNKLSLRRFQTNEVVKGRGTEGDIFSILQKENSYMNLQILSSEFKVAQQMIASNNDLIK